MAHEGKGNVTFFHHKTPSTLVHEEINHTWDITNFSFREEWVHSTQFGSQLDKSLRWRLAVLPVWEHDDSKENITVRLRNDGSLTGSSYNFEVSIMKHDGSKAFTRVESWDAFTNHVRFCDVELIERGILFDDSSNLLYEDKLTIVSKISLSIYNEMESKGATASGTKTLELALLNDLERLHDTQVGSDVTLITEDGEVRAHKAILMARSPAFAAMFSTDLQDKNPDRVNITGTPCAVLHDVLRFIYTGKSPKKDQMNIGLYVAAHKYNLKHLRDMCEKSFLSAISTDSAGALLGLADIHNAQRMKSVLIEFITRQAPIVAQTKGWKAVIEARPQLFSEVFESMGEFISSLKTL